MWKGLDLCRCAGGIFTWEGETFSQTAEQRHRNTDECFYICKKKKEKIVTVRETRHTAACFRTPWNTSAVSGCGFWTCLWHRKATASVLNLTGISFLKWAFTLHCSRTAASKAKQTGWANAVQNSHCIPSLCCLTHLLPAMSGAGSRTALWHKESLSIWVLCYISSLVPVCLTPVNHSFTNKWELLVQNIYGCLYTVPRRKTLQCITSTGTKVHINQTKHITAFLKVSTQTLE